MLWHTAVQMFGDLRRPAIRAGTLFASLRINADAYRIDIGVAVSGTLSVNVAVPKASVD